LVPAKHDPEIHGEDGLDGVEGLPDVDNPRLLSLFARDKDGSRVRALEGMSTNIKNAIQGFVVNKRSFYTHKNHQLVCKKREEKKENHVPMAKRRETRRLGPFWSSSATLTLPVLSKHK
jgi:hypothetical protein